MIQSKAPPGFHSGHLPLPMQEHTLKTEAKPREISDTSLLSARPAATPQATPQS